MGAAPNGATLRAIEQCSTICFFPAVQKLDGNEAVADVNKPERCEVIGVDLLRATQNRLI